MNAIEMGLLAVGLSMDAFAVSVGKGLAMRRVDVRAALVLALAFGGFQALMPVLGWMLASFFAEAIEAVDHWIAFGLLCAVGLKMLWDAMRDDAAGRGEEAAGFDVAELLALAVATSIDALAVGVSFAAMGVPPMPAVAVIGAVTFALTLAGVVVGSRFGSRCDRLAGVVGGCILVAIGVKVLVEHTGLL